MKRSNRMPINQRFIDSYALRMICYIVMSIPVTLICSAVMILVSSDKSWIVMIIFLSIIILPVLYGLIWNIVNVETGIIKEGNKIKCYKYIQPVRFESEEFNIKTGRLEIKTRKFCGLTLIRMYYKYDSGSVVEGPFNISFTSASTSHNLERAIRDMLSSESGELKNSVDTNV